MRTSLPMRDGVVAVLVRGERLLMIRRAEGIPFAGYWCPLSGKVEAGESQADAVVREVREEAGLEVRALRKVWECPAESAEYLLHWWLVEEDGAGELALEPREVAEAGWFTRDEIHALAPVFAADLEFVDRVWPAL
jgi:8-oxo-dGTP pyrophosphatase MutT (NUDIX family)